MSSAFLALSVQDRKLAFDNAALTLRLHPVVLKKDFWVSWLLGLLFAQPGTFRLAPSGVRQAALARDYATMHPMFMTEPPRFDVLMATLADAEAAINRI